MNIWPKSRGHYDMATFSMKETDSVKLTLFKDKIVLQYPEKNLANRALYYQSELDDVLLKKQRDEIELKTCHVFLLPEGIPQNR